MIKELWSGERYTTEELNARLKFFIGIILGLTLFGIVFVVLYSLIFVTRRPKLSALKNSLKLNFGKRY